MDQKIIEMDSVLKSAKEAVPFDRPFVLKIKRISGGKSKDKTTRTIKTETTSVKDLGNGAQEKKTITDEAVVTILNPNSGKKSTKITKLTLSTENSLRQLTLDGHLVDTDTSSFYLFIKLRALRPDHEYELIVTWDDHNNDTEVEEKYTMTTVAPNLDKRVKERVTSQFGVTPLIFRYGKSDIYDIKTTFILGVHYHVRAVDPDIPVKYYKFFSLQRVSVFGGITLNSIATDNVRKDLFANNNILLGVGFQAADAIRLSYGAVLFNEINPNPIGFPSKSVKANSYVAITLDIKLKDILGGILTTLGFK